MIQAILFPRDAWTTAKARAWMRRNAYSPIKKVHTTERHYRYRLAPPVKGGRYRIKRLPNGVKFVVEVP